MSENEEDDVTEAVNPNPVPVPVEVTPMAEVTNLRAYKEQENVAAAIDTLEGISLSMTKATGAIKRRLEELDDHVYELQETMRRQELENAKTQQSLKTRLDIADEKLRRILNTLG